MIRFSFDFTRADYDELADASRRLQGNTDWLRPLKAASYTAAAVGFLLLVARPPVPDWLAPALLVAVALFTLIYPVWYAGRELDKAWAQQASRLEGIQVEAGPDGLTWSGPSSQTRFGWAAFTQMIETRSLFLFCSGDNDVSAPIPKRSFATGDDLHAFRTMVAERIPGPAKGFPVIPR